VAIVRVDESSLPTC